MTTALVTGAFGNIGAAIAERLESRGAQVRTLTTRAAPAGSTIDVRPLDFSQPSVLASAFDGVDEFYNTYWMRTGDDSGYARAVEHSTMLLDAAAAAGVRRIAHLSVLHADDGDRYPYFRAKTQVEHVVRATGVPNVIVRPAVVFGGTSALLNQLARVLRKAPVMPIPGDGRYRVRPVHVDDVARLCVESDAALDSPPIDAVGPERPTYIELVRAVREVVGSRARLVRVPARVVAVGAGIVGRVTRQQLLTGEELYSTIDGLADSDGPSTGTARLSDWLAEHGRLLGRG
ncbi:SDR family oxidoreductase [Desertimonas flava]|uniref:SDR family oxidoreductase n=1 Tax=Desertimonas flava TaxID=2064846 RepID=UPI0013C4948D|nr:NAD-dependent epimerase/dehydratase family protein [Desertimonas flava]